MRIRIIIYVNQYTLLINLEQERKRGETIDRQNFFNINRADPKISRTTGLNIRDYNSTKINRLFRDKQGPFNERT
jgi:hypothetical protein